MLHETIPNAYKFYFKLAYTCQTKTYVFNPNITIRKFITSVKRKARSDFAIRYNEDVEIVETGQYDNINGIDAEKAPALEHCNLTLEEMFGNRQTAPAFYIRIVPISLVIDLTNDDN
jgi:hypothetical protein